MNITWRNVGEAVLIFRGTFDLVSIFVTVSFTAIVIFSIILRTEYAMMTR